MARKLKTIIELMELLAPQNYAMKWDNVGLQIGTANQDINRILVCLDINGEVINEAIEYDANLIIAHHPMIFSPLKSIIKEDPKGKLIYRAIQNDINIYVAHTNMDIAPGGLNDLVADRINLKNVKVLDSTSVEKLYKIVVFAPLGFEEEISDALIRGGAGHIGNYSHCTFRGEGIGTFKPLEETNPFIGHKGKVERTNEIRLETIVPSKHLNASITYMLQVHPYEEVAYDVIPLENLGKEIGIGRVGELEKSTNLKEIVDMIKNCFNLKTVRVSGDLNKKIKRLAIVNGSGADYIEMAKNSGCDCLITGDVKYHDAQKALENDIAIVDAGHFETEIYFVDLVTDYLSKKFNNGKMDIEIIKSNAGVNPFTLI